MVYKLSEEHELIKQSAKELAEKEIAPVAEKIDAEEIYPRDLLTKLAEYGFMGMTIDEKYGGTGTDFLSYIVALEEIAKASGTVATIMMVHNSMVGAILNQFAPEAIKEEYLPSLASGEKIGAFALSEREAGSVVSEMKTFAEKKGAVYEINGIKSYVVSAGQADVYLVVAIDKETKEPIIAIVDKDAKGLGIGKEYKTLGLKGISMKDILLKNVQVPTERVITENVKNIIRRALDIGRVSVGAIGVGLAQIAIDESVQYANMRKQFGRLIGKMGAIQDYIGDIAIKSEAARQLVYHAASVFEDEYTFHIKAAIAKAFATEVSAEATKWAIRIHGGIGYTKDRPIERFARDSRGLLYIWDTTDVLKAIVARNLLGYDEEEEAPFPV